MLRALLLVVPLLIAAAPPPAGKPDAGKGCTNRGIDYAATPPSRSGFHRLDQLPPANEILTVIHAVDGCEKPVIVRYNIGGHSARAQ